SQFFRVKCSPLSDISTLTLHDALPICTAALLIESIAAAKTMNAQSIRISQTATGVGMMSALRDARTNPTSRAMRAVNAGSAVARSEEHTSELQSRENLVCRLLLEKHNQ